MLRQAASLVGGDYAEATALSLGLEAGSRADRPSELRREAAALLNVSVEHFRHTYEPRMFGAVAQLALRETHEFRLRLTRLRDEARTPTGSRLAVEWLSRFEAMYQVWTPMTGLGGDLTANRATLLELDRPWDRDPDPNDLMDLGHTQERQADGYADDALYHFACVLAAERRFIRQFGGMWLLPDAQAEVDIGDALYRVKLESPFNEQEDSQLRALMAACGDEELDPFLTMLDEDHRGASLRGVWRRWCSACCCEWSLGEVAGRDFFPVHRNHPNIDRRCSMHRLISAVNDFCLILDDGWDQIADWYRDFPRPDRTGMTAEAHYRARAGNSS